MLCFFFFNNVHKTTKLTFHYVICTTSLVFFHRYFFSISPKDPKNVKRGQFY